MRKSAAPEFPALHAALGPPPKTLPFPGVIVCATCQDRPCCCCDVCCAVLSICEHNTPPEPDLPPAADPAVIEAVQVLAAHGIDGAKYEALQALAAERRR
jgi:hypothetical protein